MIRVRAFPAILIAAAIGTGMAHAGRHMSIDSEFGPNTITRDTNTGLEWLDLSVTAGLNSIELLPLLNGSLSDWRYATISEFSDFASSYLPGYSQQARRQAWVDLMGWNNGYVDPIAYVFEPELKSVHLRGNDLFDCGTVLYCTITNLYINISGSDSGSDEFGFPITWEDSYSGHYLVRTFAEPTPEPSTLWLLCGGLAVLLAVRSMKLTRVFRW
jgi:hypothetical protein